jgi:hypothetical protein
MQGHLKINIDLFSASCPPQLHKSFHSIFINVNENEDKFEKLKETSGTFFAGFVR